MTAVLIAIAIVMLGSAAVAMALRNTLTKRETRPPKKHGNIPL